MKFYGYFRSSTAYRCRIALNLKKVPHDFIPVHLTRDGGEQRMDAYKALNPQMLVPTVIDGEMTLTQSMAILEWLEEKHPEPPILPKDVDQRAHVRAFSYAIACDTHPLQNLRILQYLKGELGQDQDAANAWCQRWIGDGLSACEKLLVQGGHNSAFCFGDEPGMADICLVPQVFSAHRFGVDMDQFPTLDAIHKRCEERQEFRDAHPARQPDSE